MSPGNKGVFQLMKKVAFRGILTFHDPRKWDNFGPKVLRELNTTQSGYSLILPSNPSVRNANLSCPRLFEVCG